MVLISKEIRIEFARNAVKLWKMENGERHIARTADKRLIGVMKVENDLIRRSDVLKIAGVHDYQVDARNCGKSILRFAKSYLYAIVNEVPTVDAVDVVRCKDCKYYNEDCMSPHSGWCECLERGEYENHFCSYAERKEGADNG